MTDKLTYERELMGRGYKLIAGVDEVGRGPLAGPVVTACVIMDLENIIDGIDDSKKLSFKKREMLLEKIMSQSVCVNIGIFDEKEIDKINILNATKKAMSDAINGMKTQPDIVLCDAIDKLNVGQEVLGIVKGDALSYTIGAASIVAKQYRDKMMIEYAKQYPEYGFEKHKGYGTKQHVEALLEYGPCPIHRASFIRKIMERKNG